MMPIRKGDGTGLAAKGYSQVRKGDGTVLWNAIPDSEADQKLIHRWVLDDVNGTVEDSVGTSNGTNNGVTSVSGDWAGGAAGDGGSGDNYIDVGTLSTFEGAVLDNCAIAFSIQTTDSGVSYIFGPDNGSGDQKAQAAIGESDASAGELWWRFEDASNNQKRVYTNGTRIDDGNPYRVVINKVGNDANNWETYINQVDTALTIENNETGNNWQSWTADWPIFARNLAGTIGNYTDAIIDDFCIYNDSLTASEAQSYNNPWS